MRKFPVVVAFAAAFCVPSVVLAQPAATPPATPAVTPADPARIAAAERMFVAADFDAQMDRVMGAVIPTFGRIMDQQFARNANKDIPPEFVEKLKSTLLARLQQMLVGHRVEMRQGLVAIWAKHFTTAELEHLTALQSDPLFVKMRADLPEIAAESVALSQSLVADDLAKLQDELKAEMADYVRTHAKKPVG